MLVYHTFEPIFDKKSKILILGSMPSVKSREQGFYYGHPQNRFWKVIKEIVGSDNELSTIESKKKLLYDNGIALWDVIYSCEIVGSSDSSIKNVTPNDIGAIIKESNISRIFANGKTASKLYRKFVYPLTDIEIIDLPSTSPANAGYSFEDLVKAWQIIN